MLDLHGVSSDRRVVENPDQTSAPPGRLGENVMHFARVLRAAGMPIGPGQVLDALTAAAAVGLGRRDDFYWALQSVFVSRRDQQELFDQAFHIFWRNPDILSRMVDLILPTALVPPDAAQEKPMRRLAEALAGGAAENARERTEQREVEFDAALTWSAEERLRAKDFDEMSADELAEARAALARLTLPIAPAPIRRTRPSPRGARIDMRASIRASLRAGGDRIALRRRTRRRRRPPIVVLCDISGSMSRYSRMVLHFLHALTNDQDRVHVFVFGTRLTNVTRYLRRRDVDAAMAKVTEVVHDWDGGTRMGYALRDFNLRWGRRVLGQGAVVLLISDGLDRDAGEGLAVEMVRLRRSCRRLIWLNPLLRYAGFEPRSKGVQAILPYVDEFRPVHNLDSLTALADALGRTAPPRGTDRAGIARAATMEKAA
jgi:uncharacterized protein with von Willebrand factor type A (vWA) domain